MRNNFIFLIFISMLFITSCGGGGGGGSSNNSSIPSISFSASSSSVPHFTSTNLIWSSTNTTSCSALSADGFYWPEINGSNQWTNKTSTSGSEFVQIPYGTTTFVLSCRTNLGTDITSSITVTGYQAFNMASMVDFYDIYETADSYGSTEFNGYMFITNEDYNIISDNESNQPLARIMCVYQIRLNAKYQDINTAVINDFSVVETQDLQILARPDRMNIPENNLSTTYYSDIYDGINIDINVANSKLTTNSLNVNYYDYISSPSFNPDNYDLNTTGLISIDFTDEEIENDKCLVDIDNLKLFMTPNPDIIDTDAAIVGYQNHDLGFTIIYLESEYYSRGTNYHHKFNDGWSYYQGYTFSINDDQNLDFNRIDYNFGSLNKNLYFGDILNFGADFSSEPLLPFDLALSSPVDREGFDGNIIQENDFAFKRLSNTCNVDYTDCNYFSRLDLGLMMNPSTECITLAGSCNTTSPYQIFFSFDESDEIIAFDLYSTPYNISTSISDMRLWIGY